MNKKTETIYRIFVLCIVLLFSACQKEDNSQRDPDPDRDGVCDSWVSEKGLSSEFAAVCAGVDKCPNELGYGEDGCPKPQEEPVQEDQSNTNTDPDPDRDGICDSWVSEKGLSSEFAAVCAGVDNCPDKAGPVANNGCP